MMIVIPKNPNCMASPHTTTIANGTLEESVCHRPSPGHTHTHIHSHIRHHPVGSPSPHINFFSFGGLYIPVIPQHDTLDSFFFLFQGGRRRRQSIVCGKGCCCCCTFALLWFVVVVVVVSSGCAVVVVIDTK